MLKTALLCCRFRFLRRCRAIVAVFLLTGVIEMAAYYYYYYYYYY